MRTALTAIRIDIAQSACCFITTTAMAPLPKFPKVPASDNSSAKGWAFPFQTTMAMAVPTSLSPTITTAIF